MAKYSKSTNRSFSCLNAVATSYWGRFPRSERTPIPCIDVDKAAEYIRRTVSDGPQSFEWLARSGKGIRRVGRSGIAQCQYLR